MLYLCEVCGTRKELTQAEAFDSGWDYPPFIGAWGIISPRTCGECPISATVWWAVAFEKKKFEDLTATQVATVERILSEVDSEGQPVVG